jgi:hypothetical protein
MFGNLLLWRPRFMPGSIHVGIVVRKWHYNRVFSEVLGFPLPASFHDNSPYSLYHLVDAE